MTHHVAEAYDEPALVSIIVPFYKHGEFLAEAIQSVENQDYSNIECILVDDGSPVPASSFLPAVHRARIIRTDNAGVSAARNCGFRNSSGSFLLFLDADDRLPANAVSSHLRVFDEYPSTQLTFGARRFIDETGAVVRGAEVCRERSDYFRMFLESNPIGGPGSCMMRREIFAACGGFREGKATAEDYDLWLRIARVAEVRRHVDCVMEYRTHANNVSGNNEAMLAGTLETLSRVESMLTPSEKVRLHWGRRRWIHRFRPRAGLGYQMERAFFNLRAMTDVSAQAYLKEIRANLAKFLRRASYDGPPSNASVPNENRR
jgi:glycosyltransferase involved in cell wall biosynthesis